MAVIRVPDSCEALLQFVKGSPSERSDYSYFPTYAHLVAAAVGVGAGSGQYTENPKTKELDPRPIEFGVFRNQSLHFALMAFAMAHEGGPTICSDLDRMCRVVEGLADAGFRIMTERLDACGASFWLQEWELLLSELVQPHAEQD